MEGSDLGLVEVISRHEGLRKIACPRPRALTLEHCVCCLVTSASPRWVYRSGFVHVSNYVVLARASS
jgi:hypothetical protein